jgi:hypothetical protein
MATPHATIRPITDLAPRVFFIIHSYCTFVLLGMFTPAQVHISILPFLMLGSRGFERSVGVSPSERFERLLSKEILLNSLVTA